ncbi:hypothetical protein ACIQD3_17880 [Peribacillus loiseleuriae]|uniref:hypothetical protein n=1 Tax=Peribacillus loiseleuriae TaxID=1679170 RepID=UPI00381AE82B
MKQPKKWIYILSFLPGLGQFYLGLMNRGLQLMLLFFGGVFITAQSFGSLAIFLPVLVFYAYYDALNHYRMIIETGERKDEMLLQWDVLEGKKNIVGWILIVVGLISFMQMFMNWLPSEISQYIPYNFLQQVILASILVGFGVKLLRGRKEEAQ